MNTTNPYTNTNALIEALMLAAELMPQHATRMQELAEQLSQLATTEQDHQEITKLLTQANAAKAQKQQELQIQYHQQSQEFEQAAAELQASIDAFEECTNQLEEFAEALQLDKHVKQLAGDIKGA